MTDLPTKSYLTSGTATEAEFQSAIGDQYDFIAQLAIAGDPYASEVDVSGNVTPTKAYMQLDTFGLVSSDNINHILNTTVGKKMIIVRSTSSSRVLTMKHDVSGTGKIWLNGAADFVMRDPSYMIALVWDTANARWQELYRNVPNWIPSAEVAGLKTVLGLGTAASKNTGISTGQIPLYENFGTAAFVNTGTSTGQVPLANQLGTLAFLSSVTDSQLNASGVTPGTYNQLTVNAQGRITAGANVTFGGVCKAWATWNGANGALYGGYNVGSVTRNSAGIYTVNFTTGIGLAYAAVGGSDIDGAVFMQSDAGGDAVPATRCYSYSNTSVVVSTTTRGVDGGRMSVVCFG